MADRIYNVLFLCTGNSARSIMAEAIVNRLGAGTFRGFSAGSHPTGSVHPYALDLLARNDYPVKGLRSKDWGEFARPGSPPLDFVFTVCDKAAGETCPVWPGQPMTAHWGFPDPAAFEGSEAETRAVFADVFRRIHTRITLFLALPPASLDRLSLQRRLRELGNPEPVEPASGARG
jgi:protein-tyrosine-phosphatase